jgi:hypothetical protein
MMTAMKVLKVATVLGYFLLAKGNGTLIHIRMLGAKVSKQKFKKVPVPRHLLNMMVHS